MSDAVKFAKRFLAHFVPMVLGAIVLMALSFGVAWLVVEGGPFAFAGLLLALCAVGAWICAVVDVRKGKR